MQKLFNCIFALILINIGLVTFSVPASATSTDSTIELSVNTVLNISSPSVANLHCESLGELCTSGVNVNVGTNNRTGHTLQMNTTKGYSNSLTNTAIIPNATIDALASPTPVSNPSSFPANYWGYTGGTDMSSVTGGYNCTNDSTNGNYCPVLAYNSDSSSYAPNHVIKLTDAPSTTSSTSLTFAAKTDISKPAGSYATSVTFTAIANYIPNTAITDGMYMRQVDSTVCNNTQPYSTTHQIYTLIDARDNTKYTVAKLADNNCWMTQNLELGEYGSPMTLTNDTSNVGPDGYTLDFQYENNSVYKGNENKYGNYYNWSQATAGSGTTTAGEDAPYSVCPKNWRLLRTGASATEGNEFYSMLNNYISGATWNSTYWSNVTVLQFTDAPVSFTLPGALGSEGAASGKGFYGSWWSSTPKNSSYAFNPSVNTSGCSASPGDYNTKNSYRSIRCLVPSS